ncbi:intermembrane transport protein PqiB [Parvibium lacunae]|uniref:MCE family protein n=1 Tax=Parvibium lacunae TaxID=1888893 RepID=A0A368KYS3_9BURK|nr:MlaD family protein [Parvibium lacunae]RCS56556.1 MCE family protein [Parvibium lacunae]
MIPDATPDNRATAHAEPIQPDLLTASVQQVKLWRPHWIWLIPILAVLIAGNLVYQQMRSRGPVIEIQFRNGEGLEAGKTRIKYKNVDIGLVQSLRLSEDRRAVVVRAELDRSAAAFAAQDSRFWVVRPRISAGEISGLGTLISGAYIAADLGQAEETAKTFVGLEVPPIISNDLPGRQFTLKASDLGSLDIGSPLYYRRVQVGEVVAYGLDPDGKGVTLTLFIHAPYDRYVTEHARFWHASGLDVAIDATGVRVNTQSLASVLLGGIAFDNAGDISTAKPASESSPFRLQPNRTEAFKRPDGQPNTYVLYFPQSVRGLALGAPVDFRGIVIGEVRDIGVELDDKTLTYRFPVLIHVYPSRLQGYYRSQVGGSVEPDMKKLLNHLVAKGLRAQLRTSSLLTGQLYVATDFFPQAAAVKLDWSKTPMVLPTIVGGFEDMQASLQSLAKKLDAMPLDTLLTQFRLTLQQTQQTLAAIETLAQRSEREVLPETRQTLQSIQQTLQQANQVLQSDAPLQHSVRQSMQELQRAAQSLRALTELLEREPQALLRGRQSTPAPVSASTPAILTESP